MYDMLWPFCASDTVVLSIPLTYHKNSFIRLPASAIILVFRTKHSDEAIQTATSVRRVTAADVMRYYGISEGYS